MRPLILKMEMSIDGFVGQTDEKPGWPVDHYDDELSAHMRELLGSVGVHAMGRRAYEEMAPYWQTSTDPFAKPMNEIPKAVFSRTMTEATWPDSTIYRDIASGMAELKSQEGAPVITYGGATFAQELPAWGWSTSTGSTSTPSPSAVGSGSSEGRRRSSCGTYAGSRPAALPTPTSPADVRSRVSEQGAAEGVDGFQPPARLVEVHVVASGDLGHPLGRE